MPPDSVWCTMPVQLQTSHSRFLPGALRYNSPDCLVCHRTIRWANGATAPCANGRLCKVLQLWTVPRQSQKHISQSAPECSVWHRTVRCRKKTKSPTVDQLRTLTVSWRGGAPDNEQWCPVAHRTVRCAHRQQHWSMATMWLGAINTPNHHILWHPSIPNISFNTRAKDSTPRHIKYIESSLSLQINSIPLGTWERVFCVLLLLLSLRLAFFIFPFLFSSAL
jgi:hypothetical protein